MAKKVRKVEEAVHTCGECSHVVVVRRFHTLSVRGEPTLGECPHWRESRCVLLSQRACAKFRMTINKE